MSAAGENDRRCGLIALAGRPNVGKSTLFNRLVGAHLSPVTRKPQTTRYNLRGVLTRGTRQIVFVDTPGLHRSARYSLNRVLNANARRALDEVDAVVMMIECGRWSAEDDGVLEAVKACGRPALLVLNKADRVRDKSVLLDELAAAACRHDFREIFPLSALRDKDFDGFLKVLEALLPQRELLFEADRLSDRSERFLAAELVREQLMIELHQRLPYAVHVEIERFEERGPVARIAAVIFVEKDNQRAIVIGRGGARLRRVGTRARRDLERLLGRRVFLETWVKTKSAWQRDPMVMGAYAGDGPFVMPAKARLQPGELRRSRTKP